MYPEMCGNSGAVNNSTTETDKVNRICNSFIKVLDRNFSDSHVQNVVTAYVCKSPPENETALRLIASLRGEQHICTLWSRLY